MTKFVFRPKSPITRIEAEALIRAGYTPVIRWVKRGAKKRKYLTTKEAKADAALN